MTRVTANCHPATLLVLAHTLSAILRPRPRSNVSALASGESVTCDTVFEDLPGTEIGALMLALGYMVPLGGLCHSSAVGSLRRVR